MEFKLTKRGETFHYNPPVQIKGHWMLGLTSLEAYNSNFNITEESIKCELYEFPDSKSVGVSYEKVRDEVERDLDISDITATDLQDEIIAPIVNEEYREQMRKE